MSDHQSSNALAVGTGIVLTLLLVLLIWDVTMLHLKVSDLQDEANTRHAAIQSDIERHALALHKHGDQLTVHSTTLSVLAGQTTQATQVARKALRLSRPGTF